MGVYNLVDYIKELEIAILNEGKQLPLMRSNVAHLIEGELDDLQSKIKILELLTVGTTMYNEHLKQTGELGCEVKHFKYYKMYGKQPIFYSVKYLKTTSLEELIKKDKKNYKKFCPSFFVRLIRKYDAWRFKRIIRGR